MNQQIQRLDQKYSKVVSKKKEKKKRSKKKHSPKKTQIDNQDCLENEYDFLFRCHTNTIDYDLEQKKREQIVKILQKNLVKQQGQEAQQELDYMTKMEDFCFDQKEFLNYQEVIETRENYKDLNSGDFVIIFPNPDSEHLKNREVSYKEAMYVFNHYIAIMGEGSYSKKFAQAEKTSFQKAFIQLPVYTGKKIKSSQSFTEENENDNEKDKPIINQEKKFEKFQATLFEAAIQQYNNLSTEQKLKNYCHGGSLKKQINQKGDDYDWVQNFEMPPQDFLTLVRYATITALCQKAKLNVRQILSDDGKSIILIVKASELLIEMKAMESGMNKQLELGAVDLLSFEPFDQQLRPLRLKKFVRNSDALKKIVEFEEEKQFESVDTKTRKYYQKVKKMEIEEFQAILCQKQVKVDKLLRNVIDKGKPTLFAYEIEGDQPVPREMWEAYFIYMCYIEEYLNRVQQLEKSLKGSPIVMKQLNENKNFIYRLIFCMGVGKANELYYQFHTNKFQQ